MASVNRKEHVLESDTSNMHPLISWRSVVAGLLIAFFTMAGLMGLGMAFGGIGIDSETSAKSAGIFGGIWFIASCVISIFIGSYFAARVSKFQTARIGSAQGLVISALFVGFFLFQIFSLIGNTGQLAGTVLGKGASFVGQGVGKASESPGITNAISNYAEDALGNLNLKSDPRTVATGVGSRLMDGNVEAAKNYLSYQAGIPIEEADRRIAELKTKMNATIDNAKEMTGSALKSVGWSVFLMITIGALSAIAGGALGSVTNLRKPLSREQYEMNYGPQHV